MGVGEEGEGLEGAGILHAADGVGGLAGGHVFDPVLGPLLHEGAVPEGAGGEVAALEDEGRAMGVRADVLHAGFFDFGRVGDGGVLGEGVGPVDEGWVEVEDGVVLRGEGLLVGDVAAEGDVAGGPGGAVGGGGAREGGGDLAGVDLVGEVSVDDPCLLYTSRCV